jgi:hypothetical protein
VTVAKQQFISYVMTRQRYKMLNFDINTTDTQKQQLYHGDIILARSKPIICLTLHLTVAISTKSQPMPIVLSSSLAVRVFNPRSFMHLPIRHNDFNLYFFFYSFCFISKTYIRYIQRYHASYYDCASVKLVVSFIDT